MLRRLSLALTLASVFAVPVSAEEVTITYRGLVTGSQGAQPGPFTVGQQVEISYTVDDAVVDIDPDPNAGVFPGGLVSLRISIPEAGVDAVTGSGTVQTFNDFDTSDQVFFYSFAAEGSLVGVPLILAEVDFLDFQPGPLGAADMIDTDAIPTQALPTIDSFAVFYTEAGYTYVNFVAEQAAPTPGELAQDARELLRELVASGQLRAGLGAALESKLLAVLAALEAEDATGACDALRAFDNQVDALQRARQIDPATAADLRSASGALANALGC